MANFKKKPTIKEIANVVVNINNRVNEITNCLLYTSDAADE